MSQHLSRGLRNVIRRHLDIEPGASLQAVYEAWSDQSVEPIIAAARDYNVQPDDAVHVLGHELQQLIAQQGRERSAQAMLDWDGSQKLQDIMAAMNAKFLDVLGVEPVSYGMTGSLEWLEAGGDTLIDDDNTPREERTQVEAEHIMVHYAVKILTALSPGLLRDGVKLIPEE